MRWTRFALLLFGAGLVLGLVVVIADLDALARPASLAMALGILALPFGILLDCRRTAGRGRTGRERRGRQAAARRRRHRQAPQR